MVLIPWLWSFRRTAYVRPASLPQSGKIKYRSVLGNYSLCEPAFRMSGCLVDRYTNTGTAIQTCHTESRICFKLPAWPWQQPVQLLFAKSADPSRIVIFLDIPRRVASSSSGVSTAAAGRCTYLTVLPRMKTFLTELCRTFRQCMSTKC